MVKISHFFGIGFHQTSPFLFYRMDVAYLWMNVSERCNSLLTVPGPKRVRNIPMMAHFNARHRFTAWLNYRSNRKGKPCLGINLKPRRLVQSDLMLNRV